MNVLVILALASVAFLLGGRFYDRFIARRLGEDKKNPTPAVTCCDNRDFVPTKPYVVFAHHFSAIAGAGPILGPTMALLYGFLPAWLWIVFGGIFIGAVHDYTTLFISLREGGRSMAADVVLFGLAIGVLILVGKTFRRRGKEIPVGG